MRIGYYKELHPNATESIHDHIHKPCQHKARILAYMKTLIPPASYTRLAEDVIDGKTQIGPYQWYEDGPYEWLSDVMYYFEKYDLELPQEFLDYILDRVKESGMIDA